MASFLLLIDLYFLVFGIDILAGEGDTIILRLLLFGYQKVVFSFQQVCAVINRDFEIITVGYCVFRTCLDAESAENAAAVVDVINLGVPLIASDAFFIRTRIGLGF